MGKRILVLLICLGVAFSLSAAGQKEDDGIITVGVIQITLEHEYQIILHQGYLDKAAEYDNVGVIFSITEMSPEKTVSAAENLIAAGVDVLIVAPADESSWKAVLNLCKENNIPLINDGSPQPITPYAAPFTGTENYYGGQKAGEFTVNWINENIPAGDKLVVAHLTLPTFTDCIKRNDGFTDYLKDNLNRPYEVYSEVGHGSREGGLKATENLLQAHPDINILFGCNDDSALGGMSAMQAAGKTIPDNLVVGFDGALKGMQELMKESMFRCDIAQLPYTYSTIMLEKAVGLVRGDIKMEDLVAAGYDLKTPLVVTKENAQEVYDEFSGYMPK
jgi:ribose transport system substrate-binding protein